ncbi:TPA: Wsp signal transduction system chemoreceptor WspA [Pseudomonas aeruginosa]|uniref:Wsp signal transduction system chemoreceptor WspA n=1 Tax=Pseudomonas aeruginosa TaxID=287 RepID=UPI001ABD9D08|nr:Wsp signal transduction system chemoreceptor WspA [Pseudomonas aeruginosa]MBO3782686.1 Wsp signal transduction system chemoreceptor WspA [Pseudomonas aeruginosa]WNW33943.1 Wsp signal transduction system chemoreceptor WspA [Pseudomonas aeruginosa]HCF4632267.1 Wsp signal transduction system chemoreceptor WspA [Pseudomonas aeruginosa]HCF6808698.1 Wsp signal transduction system chemoreceptor WspA [Pseudomonas aeruginosa]HCI1656818.1 Wsp signal transduction system chemoreceptor WspA [Pseudomonas
MKNWTVRQRILASFAVIIAIMLLMAATAYVKMLTVEKGAYRVQDDAMPGMYFITLVRSSWTDNYLQTQELFGITDDHELSKAEADSILASEERLDQQIASYQKTMNPDEARDHELLAGFQAVRKNYLEQHDKVLELYREKRFEEAGKLVAGPLTEHWREGRKYLNEMIELNKDIADRASDNIVNAVDDAELSMLVTLLLAVVVAGICGFLLLRAITQPIQKIVRSLDLMAGGDLTARLNLGRRDEFGAIETGFNGMAEELKGLVSQAQRSSVQVTTSVTEIAATTTEIGATSREIAATSRDLVRTMSEVSGAAEQTSTLAGSGQLGLARMEETMHHVMGAADLVNAKLAILNEKAGNINQVVTTIVKVADQTNLLSLNAAIEAEKAGEYGRGFAVVATEVRRLADQTAVATYDIEQMVREIQSAVSAGVMGMDKFSEEVRRGIAEVGQVGEQLSQIIQQVQALAPRVQMVNEGMQAQATGAEQIHQALVQLGEATGQTVESLRQASFAIDELNLVANGLRNGVSRFKV